MTPNEIISSIKKSSIPTICVEGVQDKAALRLVQNLIGIRGSILCCNGRTNLFAVWERRAEFADKKVVFMADKDLFVFKKIPSEYQGIIFTDGYSLENDILATERWKSLLTSDDTPVFSSAIEMSLNYYWNECKKHIKHGHQPVWVSAHRLLADHKSGSYSKVLGYEACCIYNKIAGKPFKYLRGKNLLECIHASLSHDNRATKYSPAHIIEISTRPKVGKHLNSILKQINKKLC